MTPKISQNQSVSVAQPQYKSGIKEDIIMSIHTANTPDFTRHVGTCGDKRIAIIIQDPAATHEVHIVDTDALPDQYHQNLMDMLMTPQAQTSKWFGEYMHRQMLFDGSNALETFYKRGWIRQVPIGSVFLTPRPNQSVNLAEALGINPNVEAPKQNQYNPLNDPLAAQQNPLGVQDQQFDDIVAQEQAKLDAFDPLQPTNQHQVNLASDVSENNAAIARGLVAEAEMLEADARAKRTKAAQHDPSAGAVASPVPVTGATTPVPISDGFNPLAKIPAVSVQESTGFIDDATGKSYKTEGARKAAITRRGNAEKSAGNG